MLGLKEVFIECFKEMAIVAYGDSRNTSAIISLQAIKSKFMSLIKRAFQDYYVGFM